MIGSSSENDAPLQLNGETKLYTLEIPSDAVKVRITAPDYRIWATSLTSEMNAVKYPSDSSAENKVVLDVTDTMKYVTIVLGLTSDLNANLVERGVDSTDFKVEFLQPFDVEEE